MQNLKEALADDTLPDGTNVKKGDAVAFPVYAMGRMPYVWGSDASDFKPERWIKDSVFQPESHFKYTAFQVSRPPSLPPSLPLPPAPLTANPAISVCNASNLGVALKFPEQIVAAI